MIKAKKLISRWTDMYENADMHQKFYEIDSQIIFMNFRVFVHLKLLVFVKSSAKYIS